MVVPIKLAMATDRIELAGKGNAAVTPDQDIRSRGARGMPDVGPIEQRRASTPESFSISGRYA
jgi:hypothetical protein